MIKSGVVVKKILYVLLMGLVVFTGCATKTPTVGTEPLIQTEIVLSIATPSDESSVKASTLGGKGYEVGNTVILLPDNGFLLAGTTNQSFSGSANAVVIKLNSAGDAEWLRTYGGGCYDKVCSAIKSKEGGFLLALTTNSLFFSTLPTCSKDLKGLLIKVDENGVVEWGQEIHHFEPSEVIQTQGGSYVFAGTTYTPKKKRDFALINIAQDKKHLWQWTYDSPEADSYESIKGAVELPDGGFMLLGVISRDVSSLYPRSAILTRVSSDGKHQWSKQLDGSTGEIIKIIRLPDGFAILEIIKQKGDDDIAVIKTDMDGNVVWANLYGSYFEERSYSLMVDSKGVLVVSGGTNSTEKRNEWDGLLMGIDQRGEIEYCLETNRAEVTDVEEDEDGQLFVLGNTFKEQGQPGDIFFYPGQTKAGGLWQNCNKKLKKKPIELQTREIELKGEKGDLEMREVPTGNNVNGVIEREFPIERRKKTVYKGSE